MSTTTPLESTPAAPNDEDLDDLLQEDNHYYTHKHSPHFHLEMTPLQLDQLTVSPVRVSSCKPYSTPKKHNSMLVWQATCTYFAYAHPKCCTFIMIVVLISLLYTLWNITLNPTMEYGGVLEYDYSSVHSQFDLQQGKIDHWCLQGDNDSCRCEDPLVPTSRGEFQTWTRAHLKNSKLLQQYKTIPIKVAFVGESLVEEMNGQWMGQERGPNLQTLKSLFETRFSPESDMPGVALGIAGDASPNVLWRLLHGEMPDWLQPQVWWVSLGMNDLGRMQCSEQVVVIGILRVVEEILEQRPHAHVVVNSMLPMADLRGDVYPKATDYQDAFPNRNDKASHYVKTKPNNDRVLRRTTTIDDTTIQRKRYRKKDPVNPVLDPSATKQKKYHLFQKNRLPLWTSISAINRQLRNFCAKQERVTFFDATSIFAQRVERGKYMLNSEYISIRGHPTVKGYEAWEDAMLTKLKSMLANEEEETLKLKTQTVKDNEDATIASSSSGNNEDDDDE